MLKFTMTNNKRLLTAKELNELVKSYYLVEVVNFLNTRSRPSFPLESKKRDRFNEIMGELGVEVI